MKTITSKIVSLILVMVILTAALLGTTSIISTWNSTMSATQKSLVETVEQASKSIENEIRIYELMAMDIGCIARLADPKATTETKGALLLERQKMYNYVDAFVGDLSGNGRSYITNADYNLASRPYYQKALTGELALSEPIYDSENGSLGMMAAAPLWEKGVYKTNIVGVVVLQFDAMKLCEYVADIKLGKTGSAFMTDKNSTTIAHSEKQRVIDSENVVALAQTNAALKPVADVEKRMAAGETGVTSYTFGGQTKIVAFTPVVGTDGWSLSVGITQDELMEAAYVSMVIIISVAALMVIISILVAVYNAKKLQRPLALSTNRIIALSEGDLKSPVELFNSKDETAQLAVATKTIVDSLNNIISDESRLLLEMAGGNFNVHTKSVDYYVGDFSPILTSLRSINVSLSDSLRQINEASEQVSSGADQVSSGATALAQGATEQASSVEELSATIMEVSAKTKESADNAVKANAATAEAGKQISQSDSKMKELITAMHAIESTSTEISKVIKTIQDIAFQTNILALNAAVEAARAGEAGKGFAVVADEVRNLASKSAEAAKTTTALIEHSIKAIADGVNIADVTADNLKIVVTSSSDISTSVNNIAAASTEQASSINQITRGIEQISSVVQTNSATAEESAAASEELSAQAATLKAIVEKFTLKQE